MNKDYNAYLFDADGTLIDTIDLIYQSCRLTVKHFSGRELPWEELIGLIGVPLEENMIALLGEMSPEKLSIVIQEHKANQYALAPEYLKIFPGVKEVLEALKKRGKKLAIVTSRKADSLHSYMKSLEIHHLFDIIVTPEDTKEHKPKPEPAYKAMELLGCTPEECLFIGDSRWDIECAAAAGVKSCFVAWSMNSLELFPVKPDFTIKEMSELL